MRYPLIGTATDDPSIRRVVTTPYPYPVFYEVTDGDIIVHAVRHGRAPVGWVTRQGSRMGFESDPSIVKDGPR